LYTQFSDVEPAHLLALVPFAIDARDRKYHATPLGCALRGWRSAACDAAMRELAGRQDESVRGPSLRAALPRGSSDFGSQSVISLFFRMHRAKALARGAGSIS
jgi:hypothetical protein